MTSSSSKAVASLLHGFAFTTALCAKRFLENFLWRTTSNKRCLLDQDQRPAPTNCTLVAFLPRAMDRGTGAELRTSVGWWLDFNPHLRHSFQRSIDAKKKTRSKRSAPRLDPESTVSTRRRDGEHITLVLTQGLKRISAHRTLAHLSASGQPNAWRQLLPGTGYLLLPRQQHQQQSTPRPFQHFIP